MIGLFEPEVDIIAYLHSEEMTPEDLIVYGAYATIKRETSKKLKMKDVGEDKVEYRRERLLNVTLESGHLSVLDQAVFSIYISNIPRLATMFLVQPIYLSHLQQSMRRVEPYGVYLPGSIRRRDVVELVDRSIDLYYEMVENGVPKEDARYVIPLYTVTNIQTVGNAREITHLYLLSNMEGVPEVCRKVVGRIVEELRRSYPRIFHNYGENYNILKYYPMPNMFRFGEILVDKLADSGDSPRLLSHSSFIKPSREEIYKALKYRDYSFLMQLRNITYTILVKMSLSAFHQALRQRTLKHIPESIYHAMNRFDVTIPPSVNRSGYREKFLEMVKSLYKMYHRLVRDGVKPEEAIGVISHSHNIYDIVNLDGWNIIGALPTRRCIKAQWEIRRVVGDMMKEVKKAGDPLPIFSLPGCITFGKCPEKYPCEYKEEFEARGPLVK